MKHLINSDFELYELVFGSAIFFAGLAGFVIYFVVLYKNKQLKHTQEQELLHAHFNSELIKTQLEIQEQTMQTIGADLHDNIGQLQSLISLTLNSIESDLPDKAQQKIDAVIELNLKSIKEMRLLGRLLHGEQLLKLGLEEAIRSEITWIEKSGRFVVVYDIDGDKLTANNADKDLILFRITQEILNNIIKHSQAKEINIKLGYLDIGIRLQIIDNGAGFSIGALSEAEKGMGLKNIQKRAEIVGGEVFIQSAPGEGTFIDIFIPYP